MIGKRVSRERRKHIQEPERVVEKRVIRKRVRQKYLLEPPGLACICAANCSWVFDRARVAMGTNGGAEKHEEEIRQL